MNRLLLILIFCSSQICAKEPAISKEERKRIQSEAKTLGNASVDKAFNSLESFEGIDDLLPLEDKGKKFEADTSKEDVLNGKTSSNAVVQFLEQNPPSNAYLSDNEALFSNHDHEIEGHEEVCHESRNSIEFSVTRTLNYQIENELEKVVIRKCRGHELISEVGIGKGKAVAKKIREELEKNPDIQWFEVQSQYQATKDHDLVILKWKHIDNWDLCNMIEEVSEYRETGLVKITDEKWIYNNQNLEEIAKNENSALLSKNCFDNVPRIINGTEISRCWIENFHFRYTPPKVTGCDFLKSQFCKLKKSDCLKEGFFGCELWKRTFVCHKKLNQKQKYEIDTQEFGLEEAIWKVEYEPNKNLADVVTKLEVFKEMDRCLENDAISDIKNFKFFSGKKLRCYVNFMENLVYDCCDKMGGLAVDGLISKCDADELALSDLRNRGQCRYLGDKENYTLGIKVSKKKVFCCFPSKLARIFIEAAKDQLSLDWGSAEHPKCGGLTQAQIQQVNFDKINLSEAFEEPTNDLNERLHRLQQKIQDEIKDEAEE